MLIDLQVKLLLYIYKEHHILFNHYQNLQSVPFYINVLMHKNRRMRKKKKGSDWWWCLKIINDDNDRFLRRGFHWGDTTPMRLEPNYIRH